MNTINFQNQKMTDSSHLTNAGLPVISLFNPLLGLLAGLFFLRKPSPYVNPDSARLSVNIGSAIIGIRLVAFAAMGLFIVFIVFIGFVTFAYLSFRYS